jgi:hypothetical protein
MNKEKLTEIMYAVAAIAVFAGWGVLLAWRG